MSRDDRYYGSTSSGKTRTRSPFVADRDSQSGGLFQTGQGGRPVLPPISSGFPTSRSPAPVQYPNQYPPQQRASPGRSEHQWSNPPSQQLIYYDDPRYGTTPSSSHVSYMPAARASPSIPGDIHDLRRYPISRPSSVRREEGWSSSASTYLSGSPPMTYTDEISSPTATYPPHYESYQVPPQGSYYPTTVPDNRNIPFPVPSYNQPSYNQPPYNQAAYNQASYNQAPYNQASYSQASYNQVPYNPPAQQMHMGSQRSAERVVLPRKEVHPYARYSGTPQYVEAEPEVVIPPEEPAKPTKPKRKRADPVQLEVLNRTYQRTAFPSTEERAKLAEDLGMPPRSVQIWFQNKRQHDRQASRQIEPPVDRPRSSVGSGYGGTSSTAHTSETLHLRPSRDSIHPRAPSRGHERSSDPHATKWAPSGRRSGPGY